MDWRLGFALWLAGLPGVVALTGYLLQSPPLDLPSAPPPWVIALASGLQSVLLLSIAAFGGTKMASGLGLQAPLLSSLLKRKPVRDLIHPRIAPAIAGSVLGLVILLVYSEMLPGEVRELQQQKALPLALRVLYGGVTEEILIRWGLMTGLAWLIWRICSGQPSVLPAWIAWAAIAISALVFGLAHLPAVHALLGEPGAQLVGLILALNVVFGVLAGYLFWRWGLETAIFVHVFAHIGFAVIAGG